MKLIFSLFFLFPLLLLKGQNNKDDAFFDLLIESEKKGFRSNSFVKSADQENTYDLKYHKLEWKINPAINFIVGKVTSYFVVNTENFNSIKFDLSNTLTVDSVLYNNSNLVFENLENNILSINLPNVIAQGNLDSLSIYYKGTPLVTGFGSFRQDEHAGVPIIWTLSEPFGAMEWWPCKQSLNDKIDSVDIIVTTPQEYSVASNGLLIGETIEGDNKICHWKTNYPIASYLIAIGVTNYSIIDKYVKFSEIDSLQVLGYAYPENLINWQEAIEDVDDILFFFDSLIVRYPFSLEKYGYAQFGSGGGMEHQSISFMTNLNFALQAHETAHQWFGDKITCGSWEDIWLNEGFATYFEGLCQQRFFPENFKLWKSDKISNITSEINGSVKCSDTTTVNRIFSGRLSYNKGAYLLHMLRWKLGNEKFFQSLKNYLNDPALAYNYAKTEDLINHLEITSGENLTQFFDQWYYGEGYPSYQIQWFQNSELINDIVLNQTQSHSSVSFFSMPVPIKFVGSNKDTTVVFEHNYSGQSFSFESDFEVTQIIFDPEYWLISKSNTINEERVDIKNAGIIFPNPAANEITVRLQLTEVKNNCIIFIYNDAGQLIDKHYVTEKNDYVINIKQLPTGQYNMLIKSDEVEKNISFQKIK
jgi:aminopeptidase N